VAAAGSVHEHLRSLCPTLSVGVLSADLMRLGDELSLLEDAGVGTIHVDVMDGRFAPVLTVGPAFIKGLRTPLLKDIHLMVHEPSDVIPEYVAAGADIITVHVESAVHIHRVLQRLGQLESTHMPGSQIVRGLALGPATPLEWLTPPLLDQVEMVVLLAVDPGWSGQRFAVSALDRLARVKTIIEAHGRPILTCVDGGITRENIGAVAAAGADMVVAGSAVFAGGDTVENVAALMTALRAG
jgi:ribulose-phosphate 3-epimerase